MPAPPDYLSGALLHPYWLSYSVIATYIAFIRKKGPLVKRGLEGAMSGVGDLNHRLCKVIKRIRADWRDVRLQPLARSGRHPERGGPDRAEVPLHEQPRGVQRA